MTLLARDGKRQAYPVGEYRHFHLDQAGNRITGDLRARYPLSKKCATAKA